MDGQSALLLYGADAVAYRLFRAGQIGSFRCLAARPTAGPPGTTQPPLARAREAA